MRLRHFEASYLWGRAARSVRWHMYARLAVLALLILEVSCTFDASSPAAVDGRVDIPASLLDGDKVIELDKGWELYRGELLAPSAAFAPNTAQHVVPGVFDEHGQVCATYRLHLRVPRAGERLAIAVPRVLSSFVLWANDEELASSGKVSCVPTEMRPAWRDSIAYFTPHSRDVTLVMHAANTFYRHGGVGGAFLLGRAEALGRQQRLRTALLVFIYGSLCAIGVYFVGLFLLLRRDRASLYFGIYCALVGTYVTNEKLFADLGVHLPWGVVYRLVYLTYVASVPIFVLYLRSLFPAELPRWFSRVLVGLAGAFALLAIALPDSSVSATEPFYHASVFLLGLYLLWTLVKAARHRRLGARLALLAYGVLYFTYGLEIGADQGVMNSSGRVPVGVFIFIALHTLILAQRFRSAWRIIEDQSAALRQANVELDEKVRARTASLAQSLEEKQVLLAELHHRVKNNMQIIVSLLNLQSDRVADAEAVRALAETSNRVRSMLLVHDNLYQADNLACIRAGDYLEAVVKDVLASHGAKQNDIRCQVTAEVTVLDFETAGTCGLIVSELVHNALKHAFGTRRSGSIRVRLAADGEHGYTLRVEDDGVGLARFEPDASDTLGLRLVQALVRRRLRGDLSLEGGPGTRFVIAFPAEVAAA